jgi:hypothetical protein
MYVGASWAIVALFGTAAQGLGVSLIRSPAASVSSVGKHASDLDSFSDLDASLLQNQFGPEQFNEHIKRSVSDSLSMTSEAYPISVTITKRWIFSKHPEMLSGVSQTRKQRKIVRETAERVLTRKNGKDALFEVMSPIKPSEAKDGDIKEWRQALSKHVGLHPEIKSERADAWDLVTQEYAQRRMREHHEVGPKGVSKDVNNANFLDALATELATRIGKIRA